MSWRRAVLKAAVEIAKSAIQDATSRGLVTLSEKGAERLASRLWPAPTPAAAIDGEPAVEIGSEDTIL